MLQLGGELEEPDRVMAAETRAALTAQGFDAVTASDVKGTGEFLNKIIDLIRGCGFAVAVFSDKTPARTLANIFFEIGVAGVLGKPVQLVLTGKTPTPSDFVRSEWIAYKPGSEDDLRNELRASLERIDQLAGYYRTIGEVALEAPQADLELCFERFKQAVLIGGDPVARTAIERVRERLADARRAEGADDMASHSASRRKPVSPAAASLI